MRKWKIPLLLLLTAALIVAGAYLPKVIGDFLERASSEGVGYGEIQSVELELRERNTLSMLEKVYLAQHSEAIAVSESDTAMTTEQAISAAEAALEPYRDAGLLRGWEGEYTVTARPVLSLDAVSGLYGYFWCVYLTFGGKEPYSQLNLMIDDETGKIIDIYFWNQEQIFPYEKQSYYLEAFIQIYMSELGLEPSREAKDTTTSSEGRSTQYWWSFPNQDGILDFGLEFCCFTQGFFTN